MKGLTAFDRLLVEKIRNAKSVTICIDYGTRDELAIHVGGKAPHDIALAVQEHYKQLMKTSTTNQ